MGQFDAIKGMAALSVPVSEINPIYSGTDSKRQQALLNSRQLAQGIYESVDDYYKRRAEFLAEQNKKIQAENTAIAQKKYNNVANLDIWNTNNLSTLQNAQNQLASFFRFTHFNNLNPNFDNQIYLAKKGQRELETRIAQIKQNGEAPSGSRLIGNYDNSSNYAAVDFQDSGFRDFLG